MSDGRGSRWSKIKNLQTALRPPHNDRGEGQTRGWERQREDHPLEAEDPPPPNRPVYGHSQHYPSDPGPHSGFVPGYNSPPPSAQGSPPSLYNQHYQGQFQAGFSQQGYVTPPHPNSYQSPHPQAYGQNQGYMSPPPPAPNPLPHPSYQQQPTSSAYPRYQGGQGAYPYPYSQTTYQPASNSYSPPLPPRPNNQDTQGTNQRPNNAGPSYPIQSSGGPLGLSRTFTAPAALHCEHRNPGNGLLVAPGLIRGTVD